MTEYTGCECTKPNGNKSGDFGLPIVGGANARTKACGSNSPATY